MNELDFEEMVETIDNELQGIEFEMPKSRVYAKLNEKNCIVAIEGEYSLSNIDNFEEWTLIDEGEPCDRLNLAQTHYFEGGLFTDDMVPRYKWNGQETVARTEAEIEADRAAMPKQPVMPTYEERLAAMESAMLAMAMALGEE